MMKNLLLIIATSLVSVFSHAGLIDYFKEDDGHTNWQYLANTAGGLLILLLGFAAIMLYLSQRKARKANRELEAIRNVLEQKVEERTANLNESNQLLKESNQLLKESNQMLAGEIDQHRSTSNLLRSSEAYIKNILESMPLILIGLNGQLEVTQWNRRAEQITSIESNFAIGKNLWDAYPTITVSPDQVKRVLEKNMPETIKHSQRGQFYFDITIYPFNSSDETGLVILIDNVTQRILTENMLVQRDKMSSMGELASTMAHDIDIPLQAMIRDVGGVLSSMKVLKPEDIQPAHIESAVKLLADATAEGTRASKVISNLLSFSRSSEVEKKPAMLTDIIDGTIALACDVLSAPSGLHFKDIAIERNYEQNLPSLPCYEAELQQVFLSLFRHACNALAEKAGGERSPQIKVEVSERYDALWVKVQHNGAGLDSREQQYIFEPFFNNSSSDSDYDQSRRLSFSYFIVTEHHQGQMAVTSDPAIGTTFHLHFQLAIK